MDELQNIFARNCELRRIDKQTASDFLKSYHRLGDTGGRYRYGLYVHRNTGAAETQLPEGTLVAVSLFSNARRWTKGEKRISSYEWIRYASLPGIRVVGGMGKVLRTFIEEVRPDDIMSYADMEYPDGGDVYKVLGFTEEGIIEKAGFKNMKYRLKLTEY